MMIFDPLQIIHRTINNNKQKYKLLSLSSELSGEIVNHGTEYDDHNYVPIFLYPKLKLNLCNIQSGKLHVNIKTDLSKMNILTENVTSFVQTCIKNLKNSLNFKVNYTNKFDFYISGKKKNMYLNPLLDANRYKNLVSSMYGFGNYGYEYQNLLLLYFKSIYGNSIVGISETNIVGYYNFNILYLSTSISHDLDRISLTGYMNKQHGVGINGCMVDKKDLVCDFYVIYRLNHKISCCILVSVSKENYIIKAAIDFNGYVVSMYFNFTTNEFTINFVMKSKRTNLINHTSNLEIVSGDHVC